jgi:hypothetical protein
MKSLKILILVAATVALVTQTSAADSSAVAAQEDTLLQKLETLNREVVAVQRQLKAIRDSDPERHKEDNEKIIALQTAQSTESNASSNAFGAVIKKVKLQQSVFDKDAFAKPASISYTHSGGGSSSYALDVGLGLEMQPRFFPWGETLSSSFGVDYHRNSTVGALKNLFQAGAQFEDTLGFAASSGVSLDTTGDVAYKVNRVNHVDSVEGSFKIHPVITFEKMGLAGLSFLNTDNFHRTGCARWRWEPFFGAQYENAVQTGSATASGRHVLLGYGAELLLYPFYRSIGKKVEVTASYKGWQPFSQTGVYRAEKNSSFFEGGITYLFVESNPIKVGAETSETLDMGLTLKYQNGDNLETGDKHLDLFTVALTSRF